MADTLVKRVLLRIVGDDGDTEHKIDSISRKADELGRKHPELKVRIDTAAASAKVAVLRKELRSLDDTGGSSGPGGMIGKLLFGGGGSGGGGGAAASGGGGLAMLAAAIPLVEALAVEATGLASGFAAAGLGVGAFAALAIPSFQKVTAGYTSISQAQKAYQTAVFNEKTDPTKAHLAAVHTALLKVRDAWHQMTPAQRQAVRGLQGFTGEYHKMVLAFQPDAFKIFNEGLKIASNLLPNLKPFADTAATAIDGLLKKLAKFTAPASPFGPGGGPDPLHFHPQLTGFQQFLAQLHKLEGPAITAIGAGFGRIGVSLSHLLTIMSKKDVVNAINIAFDVLSGSISALTWVVHHTMHSWDELQHGLNATAHAFDTTRHHVAMFAHDVAAHFDEVRHDAANLAHNIASYFDEARANIARWASDVGTATGRVVSWFRGLPGRILGAVSGFGRLLWNAGADLLRGLIGGIKSMITGVIGTVVGIGKSILTSITGALGIGSPSRITFQHGRWLAEGLARGMLAGTPDVTRAAARMASGALPGPGAYPRAGAAGGGNVYVTVSGFVGSEHQLAAELQRVLIGLKRKRGQPVDTSRGLGLA